MTESSIGRNFTSADNHFNGPIDDVRIYNRAICPSEVTQIYGLGSPVGVRIIIWLEVK